MSELRDLKTQRKPEQSPNDQLRSPSNAAVKLATPSPTPTAHYCTTAFSARRVASSGLAYSTLRIRARSVSSVADGHHGARVRSVQVRARPRAPRSPAGELAER